MILRLEYIICLQESQQNINYASYAKKVFCLNVRHSVSAQIIIIVTVLYVINLWYGTLQEIPNHVQKSVKN
jgi:hypothetical protein